MDRSGTVDNSDRLAILVMVEVVVAAAEIVYLHDALRMMEDRGATTVGSWHTADACRCVIVCHMYVVIGSRILLSLERCRMASHGSQQAGSYHIVHMAWYIWQAGFEQVRLVEENLPLVEIAAFVVV